MRDRLHLAGSGLSRVFKNVAINSSVEGVVLAGWHWQVIILDNLCFFAIMGEMGFGVLCCLRIVLV